MGRARVDFLVTTTGHSRRTKYCALPTRRNQPIVRLRCELVDVRQLVSNRSNLIPRIYPTACYGNYFLTHRWSPRDLPLALYSERKLRNIHRSFGHPSVHCTEGLLKHASRNRLHREGKDTIEMIGTECGQCNTHATAPRSFKLILEEDSLRFDHSIQVGTMFLLRNPVLHILDLGTHFSSAVFLKWQSAHDIWASIESLSKLVYACPGPRNRGSGEFRHQQGDVHQPRGSWVSLHEAAMESTDKIRPAETYHATL